MTYPPGSIKKEAPLVGTHYPLYIMGILYSHKTLCIVYACLFDALVYKVYLPYIYNRSSPHPADHYLGPGFDRM